MVLMKLPPYLFLWRPSFMRLRCLCLDIFARRFFLIEPTSGFSSLMVELDCRLRRPPHSLAAAASVKFAMRSNVPFARGASPAKNKGGKLHAERLVR